MLATLKTRPLPTGKPMSPGKMVPVAVGGIAAMALLVVTWTYLG